MVQAGRCPVTVPMRGWSSILLLSLGLLLGTSPAGAEPLRLAVAGNFVPALEQLLPDFEREHEQAIVLSSGSTGKLYAQIRQGAPFDVFLAADRARPEALEREHRTVAGTRRTYAVGRLALWAPRADPRENLVERLRANPPPRLAIANPRVAPFGAAAKSWLREIGVWEQVARNAVRGENVAQTFHFVASGNAELGLVALGQLRSLSEVPGTFLVVPADGHEPIHQQGVLLKDTPTARAFLNWLTSSDVQDRLHDLGYDSP